MDLPAQFKPQSLRCYINSYGRIARNAVTTMRRVTAQTATKGAITNPEGRRAPTRVEPWTQAELSQQRAIIDAILADFPDDMAVFPCRQHVDHVGEELVRTDSGNAVLLFDADTLHKPATRVLHAALANPSIRDSVVAVARPEDDNVMAPGKVTFPTHRNSVPSTAGVKRKRDEEIKRNDSLPRSGPADVFCIYEPLDSSVSDDDQEMDTEDPEGHTEGDTNVLDSITVAEDTAELGNTNDPPLRGADLLFVKEAKAPHKLTPTLIRQAVGSGDITLRPADIMNGEDTASESARPISVTQSRYWFAAVCSQLYSSMIEAGLRYGMITTGAYYVFVSIDPERPSILRYSVCKQTPADIHTSALMRIVAFALLAMCNGKLPKTIEYDEIYRRAGLNWVTEIQNPSFSTEDAPGETPQDTPGMESYKDGASASPDPQPHQANSANLPTDTPSPLEEQCETQGVYPSPPPQFLGKRQSRASSEIISQDAPKRQKTCVDANEATQPTTPTSSPRPLSVSSPVRSVPLRKRAYCSSACLQAVQHGSIEPTRCPNQADHDRAGRLTMVQLREKLHAQLTGPLDGTGEWDYQFLRFSPGETQTVKLWLKSHGYTIIAKAFQAEDLSKMRGEARIYDRLQHLQGGCVPVCLGTIELPVEKSLIRYGQFVGLLLLAWAGWGMDEWPRLGIRGVGKGGEVDRRFACALTKEVQNVLMKIHGAGVLHRDVALRNVMLQEITRRGPALHSEFTLRIQMIDFELSRTRAMYRRSAEKRLAHKGRQDLTAVTLGHAEFTKACAEEMEICTSAIAQWCE